MQMINKISSKHGQAMEMLNYKTQRLFPIIDMIHQSRYEQAMNAIIAENNNGVIADVLNMLQISGRVDNLSLDSQIILIDKASKIVEKTQYFNQVNIGLKYIVKALNVYKMEAINFVSLNKQSKNIDLKSEEKLHKYNKFIALMKTTYTSPQMTKYIEKARSNSSTVEKFGPIISQLDNDCQYQLSKTK